MDGRDFVTPDDVQALAVPVLEHRLVVSADARFSGIDAANILSEIISSVAVPSADRRNSDER